MTGRLTETQIEELLQSAHVGRLGCLDKDRPYVVPLTYIYHDKTIIGHSVEGLKIQVMRQNPRVCFQVDEIKGPTNWKSVIVWGEFKELTDEKERYAAMKLFVERLMHLKLSETAVLPELGETRLHPRSPGIIKPVIYKIVITEKTGRYESE